MEIHQSKEWQEGSGKKGFKLILEWQDKHYGKLLHHKLQLLISLNYSYASSTENIAKLLTGWMKTPAKTEVKTESSGGSGGDGGGDGEFRSILRYECYENGNTCENHEEGMNCEGLPFSMIEKWLLEESGGAQPRDCELNDIGILDENI
uniref:Uncharacterized protein n=1 Tax=Cucumis sativus TaxID=3659 RepID=A0A0A0KXC7_CUCSA